MKYDPNAAVDPRSWEALDESEKAEAVRTYHQQRGIRPPNAVMHALMHVIVENQIALGDEFPARSVLERLMGEGLNRHEAVHAIGSIVAEHVFSTLRNPQAGGNPQADYIEKLRNLTVESWKSSIEEE